MSSEGDIFGQVNQSVTYIHSCLQLAILIKTNTNNPSRMSVVQAWSASAAALQAWFG